jgi:hypothetical protein
MLTNPLPTATPPLGPTVSRCLRVTDRRSAHELNPTADAGQLQPAPYRSRGILGAGDADVIVARPADDRPAQGRADRDTAAVAKVPAGRQRNEGATRFSRRARPDQPTHRARKPAEMRKAPADQKVPVQSEDCLALTVCSVGRRLRTSTERDAVDRGRPRVGGRRSAPRSAGARAAASGQRRCRHGKKRRKFLRRTSELRIAHRSD